METCEGVKESEVLENKSGFKRFAVLVMGIVFNFILSIILLFINGLIYGSPVTSPYLGNVLEGSAAELGGLKENDLILKIMIRVLILGMMYFLKLSLGKI